MGANGLTSVSCVGTTFCAAVDSGGKALTFDGTIWTKPSDVDGATGLVAVSCATASYCLAVDARRSRPHLPLTPRATDTPGHDNPATDTRATDTRARRCSELVEQSGAGAAFGLIGTDQSGGSR